MYIVREATALGPNKDIKTFKTREQAERYIKKHNKSKKLYLSVVGKSHDIIRLSDEQRLVA